MAFAASTIIAGIGLAASIGGTAYNIYSNNQAAEKQNAAAQQQAGIAALQASNVDNLQAKLKLDTQQSDLQIATNKQVIGLQQNADDIRQQAAQLDATRRIRDAIRSGVVAAGSSVNTAADQGANAPGSTATKQARASIAGQTNLNIQGTVENLDAGTRLYDINKNISQDYLAAQDANQTYVDQSEAIQSKVLENQRQVYAMGGQASLDYGSAALAQGQASIGAGLVTFGSNITNNFDKINSLTNYFTGKVNSFGQTQST